MSGQAAEFREEKKRPNDQDDVAEEDVPIEGFLRIDELSLHETGVYQLKIVAKEDCILTLITDYHDGEPEIESVPLSSAGVYHLDIVVTDDNE